jgi:hypothetical protein
MVLVEARGVEPCPKISPHQLGCAVGVLRTNDLGPKIRKNIELKDENKFIQIGCYNISLSISLFRRRYR